MGAGKSHRGPAPSREPLTLTGDWREQVKLLEEHGRTRDAGRPPRKNQSYADAARLFEAGGDLSSAWRNAAAGSDLATAKRLASLVNLKDAQTILEKSSAACAS